MAKLRADIEQALAGDQRAVAHRPQGPPGRRARRQGGLRRDRQPRRRPPRRLRRLPERRPVGTPHPGRARRMPRTSSTAGCSSSPARAASARPPSPPALALLAAAAGQAHAGLRGRRQGRPGRLLRDRPDRLRRRARSQPGLCAMSMDTEESLKEYLSCSSRCRCWPGSARWPARSTSWPPPRPGVQGDPHRRQALLGGARAPLRPRRGRRRRPPATSSASWPRRRPSTSWCRSAWSATRPAGCSTSSSDPATHRRW